MIRAFAALAATALLWGIGLRVAYDRVRWSLDEWEGHSLRCQNKCQREGHLFGSVRIEWIDWRGSSVCECIGDYQTFLDQYCADQAQEVFHAR